MVPSKTWFTDNDVILTQSSASLVVVHDSEQLGGGLVLQPDVDLVPELPLDAVEQLPSDLVPQID